MNILQRLLGSDASAQSALAMSAAEEAVDSTTVTEVSETRDDGAAEVENVDILFDVDGTGQPVPPPSDPSEEEDMPSSSDGIPRSEDEGNLPDRCKHCNGWGHTSTRAHACPFNKSPEKYENYLDQQKQRGLESETVLWNTKYPIDMPPPCKQDQTSILQAPSHKLFTAKKWEPLDWVSQNGFKSPDFIGDKNFAHINPEVKAIVLAKSHLMPVDLYNLYKGTHEGVDITERMKAWTTQFCERQSYGTDSGPSYTKSNWKLFRTEQGINRVGPSVDDINKLEGLYLLNGVYPRPSLRCWFEGDPLGVESEVLNVFRKSGYKKIEQMKQVLRFQSPVAPIPSDGEFKNDGLHLVRPILNALLKQCEDVVIGGEKMSLDEIVVGFQGNFSFGKSRIKYKKEGDGIIIDAVCDGKTGALITFKFRCDDTAHIPGRIADLSPLHNRCLSMLRKPCLARLWRTYFHDNLFSSIKMAFYGAIHSQSKFVGPMRGNRGAPSEAQYDVEKNPLDPAEKKKRQLHSGRSFGIKLRDGVTKFGFIVVCVHDQKPIMMLSTASSAVTVRDKVRKIAQKIEGKYTGELIDHPYFKLCLIDEYNKFMGGVDLQDRLRWYYRVDGKHTWRNRKWTWALYLWVIETRCTNAYIAYKILLGEMIEDYEAMITVEFQRLQSKERNRRLRNRETRREDAALQLEAKKNIESKYGKKPTIVKHYDFQLSVARSKLGLSQVHPNFVKRKAGERKWVKAKENKRKFLSPADAHKSEGRAKRNLATKGLVLGSGKPVTQVPWRSAGKGLVKDRPLKFHGMHFRREPSNKRCQVCRLQGPTFTGGTYRNGKSGLPRARFECLVQGCFQNYCSSECFNLYHYGEETPVELPCAGQVADKP
mgnify:CR=1 FL=1